MSELTTSSGLGSAAPFWVGIRGFGALPCNFLTILRRASTCEQGSGSWSQPAGVWGGARCPPSRAPTSCNAGMRRGEILAPCSPHACSCSLWGTQHRAAGAPLPSPPACLVLLGSVCVSSCVSRSACRAGGGLFRTSMVWVCCSSPAASGS